MIAALEAAVAASPPPSHSAPILTGLSAPAAPRSGRFLLFGSGFGATQGSAYVEVAGQPMPLTRWSDTAITAYVRGDVPLGPTTVRVVTEQGGSNTLDLLVEPLAPGAGHVAWRFQMDSPYMLHRPAVAPDGTVYAQDVFGFVYALSSDGRLLWIVNAAGYPSGGGGEGPVALGEDGTIYVVANPLGTEVQIVALAPDGALRWRFSDGNTQGVISGPAVGPDGNVYFVTDLGGRGATSVTPDGDYRWSNAGSPMIEEYGQLGEEIAFGPESPGATIQMYAAFDCRNTSPTPRLFAFTLGGNQRFAVSTGGQSDPLGQRQGQPAVGRDGTVYLCNLISSSGWRLQAFNPQNGAGGWTYGEIGTNSLTEPDVGADGTIYVTRNLVELHAVTAGGARRWMFSDGTILFGPVASPADDAIVVGGRITYGQPGFVKAVDGAGGLLWTEDLPSEGGLSMVPSSRPMFSDDGSRAYVGTDLPGQPNGQEYSYLYAFNVRLTPVEVPQASAGALALSAQPNPFRDATDITFRLNEPGPVRLRVFDVSGRLIASPIDAALGAGPHVVRWPGPDARGVAAGTYFVRLDAATQPATLKLQHITR